MHLDVTARRPFAERVLSDTDVLGSRYCVHVFSKFRHFGSGLLLAIRFRARPDSLANPARFGYASSLDFSY